MNTHCNRLANHWSLAKVIVLFLGTVLCQSLDAHAGQKNGSSAIALYQQALHEEEALGNPKGAIALYERVIASKPDHRLAANALIHMGGCYEKLEIDETARKTYQRVLQDYSDQKGALELARARLGLSGPRQAVEKVWTATNGRIEAVSPNGRYLIGIRHGFPEALLVHDTVSGKTSMLPTEAGYVSQLCTTPDGKKIIYQWENRQGVSRDELRIINVDGTDPRTLMDSAEYQAYEPSGVSPDGKVVSIGLRRKDGSWQIGLVSLETGKPQILRNLDWRDAYAGTFSPDGRWLAYSAQSFKGQMDHAVYIIAVNGSSAEQMIASSGPINDRPRFTPDGSRVVFISDQQNHADLVSVRVSEGHPDGLPEIAKTSIGRPGSNVLGIGFTKDGTYYFGEKIEAQAVYTAEVDPASWKVKKSPIQISDGLRRDIAGMPTWSPDGNLLVYVSRSARSPDANVTLVTYEVHSGQEREIWSGMKTMGPRVRGWSADGKSLIVQGPPQALGGTAATEKSRAIDLQTLQEHPFPQDNLREQFTRDWKYSYYSRVDKGSTAVGKPAEPDTARIFKKDLSSGLETEVYRATNVRALPGAMPSPDGSSVAFFQTKSGKNVTPSFGILNLSSGELRELASVVDSGISWTPDSRAILFMQSREIWVQPADGSKPYDIGIHFDDSAISTPSISPDGTHLAFDARSEIRNVWTVKNLFSEKSVAKK